MLFANRTMNCCRLRNLLPGLSLALLAAAVLLSSGCAKQEPQPEARPTETQTVKPADTYFSLTLGQTPLQAQLALSSAEQQRGLMHRDSLAEDHGMLFVFANAQQQAFWMKNTLIPLDIGYFDAEGVLREVYQLYPGNLNAVESFRNDIQFALEMNEGWFARQGVAVGTALDMEQLAEAIRQRGQSPAAFGL